MKVFAQHLHPGPLYKKPADSSRRSNPGPQLLVIANRIAIQPAHY